MEPTCKYNLGGRVSFVTGAAGAIGAGICRGLLEANCRVAVTDLPGERLDGLVNELKSEYGKNSLLRLTPVCRNNSLSVG